MFITALFVIGKEERRKEGRKRRKKGRQAFDSYQKENYLNQPWHVYKVEFYVAVKKKCGKAKN